MEKTNLKYAKLVKKRIFIEVVNGMLAKNLITPTHTNLTHDPSDAILHQEFFMLWI